MRKKRLMMRRIRKALTSKTFTGSVVSALAFFVAFNLLWTATRLEFLKVCAFAFFAAIFAWIGYTLLTEDPLDRYIKVNRE